MLITAAMGLTVLALQQSTVWGWGSPATWVSLIAGVALMAVFVRWELRTLQPLLRLRIFRDRGLAVENVVPALMSIAFVPFFFFASVYAQVSLARTHPAPASTSCTSSSGSSSRPRSAGASWTGAAPGRRSSGEARSPRSASTSWPAS
jgi:hypothetical protein